jgi:hypothetical protein
MVRILEKRQKASVDKGIREYIARNFLPREGYVGVRNCQYDPPENRAKLALGAPRGSSAEIRPAKTSIAKPGEGASEQSRK